MTIKPYLDDGEVTDANEVTCPYCGHEWGDSWELRSEEGKDKCEECGKTFRWNRESRVWYNSTSDCTDNNEEHDWQEWSEWIERSNDYFTKPNYTHFRYRKCSKCAERDHQEMNQ